MAIKDNLLSVAFVPFRFSRNTPFHSIDPADITLTNRSALTYFLDLQVPQNRYFGDFVTLHQSVAKEAPMDSASPTAVFEGVTFPFNRANGKLDGFLEYEKPDFGATQIKQVVSQSMQFRIREKVTGRTNAGAPFETNKTNAPEWILKAGLSAPDLFAHQTGFFSTLQSSKRQFLSWMPNGMKVSPNQDLFLSFLLNLSPMPASIQLVVEVDGLETVLGQITNPQFGGILLCPVGQYLSNFKGKKVGFFLAANGTHRISEVKTFEVLRAPERFERSISFINSLGGWDTVNFTGQGTQKRKTEKKKAKKERYKLENIDFVDQVSIASDSSIELTVSTGYYEKNSIQIAAFFDELLMSEQIFLKTEKGHRFLELVDTELTQPADDSELVSKSFTFRFVEENAFSNADPGTDISARPTAWRGVDFVHILDSFGKRTGLMRPVRLQKIYADTNTEFRPLTFKMNTAGTEGFIDSIVNPQITPGTTPFPNTEINREGSFIRAACTAGGTPGRATIVIPANKYGGERAGDAQELAELEFRLIDTQAYANTNGACFPDPWSYAVSVPVNFAHFRWNVFRRGTAAADSYVYMRGTDELNKMGNFWAVFDENPSAPYVFAPGTNNIQLPTNFPTNGHNWVFGFYGSGPQNAKIYVNGTLIVNQNFETFTNIEVPRAQIPSQAKVYLLLT